MDDLNGAKTEDVKAFFDLYYAPNNATLVVAGDFETVAAKKLITDYFGGIPRAQDAPTVTCDQPYGSGQIRRRWPDAKANLPGVLLAYRIPEYKHADFPALSLLATILGQGESSRINKAVVRDLKLAQFSVSLLNPASPRRGPGVFLTLAVVNQGVGGGFPRAGAGGAGRPDRL
jgi:predicted Zn-dependent peptidase